MSIPEGLDSSLFLYFCFIREINRSFQNGNHVSRSDAENAGVSLSLPVYRFSGIFRLNEFELGDRSTDQVKPRSWRSEPSGIRSKGSRLVGCLRAFPSFVEGSLVGRFLSWRMRYARGS